MARYEVRCEVEMPDTIPMTDEQIEEWATYYLNATSTLSNNNPLKWDFEAVPFTVRVKRLP